MLNYFYNERTLKCLFNRKKGIVEPLNFSYKFKKE